MGYRYDKTTEDIVITGFEKGISDDPYEGISNIVNCNLISIPKEASVNFATTLSSNPYIAGGTGGASGNSGNGQTGGNYGGGGGGIGNTGTTAGAGAPGYVIVTTYF